jgi:glucoamylase
MQKDSYAHGAPGIEAKWASSVKSGLGKALNTTSEVTFTLGEGVINEIYFPQEDCACTREMGFIVTDGKGFVSEEKQTEHEVKLKQDGVPAYEIVNLNKGNYQITKEVLTDPFRNTVLQKVNFKSFNENNYHLYVLLSPHLNNQGNENLGWVADYKGVTMLFARAGGLSLALACSTKWVNSSVGYCGYSDGRTDLEQHKKMTWFYTRAENGNIMLTAENDLQQGNEFVLSLGFGREPFEAANNAWGSILDGFDSAKRWYAQEWNNWLRTLHDVQGKIFKMSAAVLRMHEAKSFPGAVVASLSIPWGDIKGDKYKAGYHVVWPRDLVESAGGFIALKTMNDALRILNYLVSTQQRDGSWSQNMWLSGEIFWRGVQVDQTALPLLIIDKCIQNNLIDPKRMNRYWPLIKKAITFLAINGPFTDQDRWEEEKGFTPFTVATSIAGMLVAADIAEINNDKQLATFCRETADNWNDNIENWLYATGTKLAKELGVDGYYIRTNPFYEIPAAKLGDRTVNLRNLETGQELPATEVVSVDALALVRFGLRAANDPRILNTVKVIDAKLKVETPAGPCWHRYNHDGYGEDENGNGFTVTGIGRAWPLLTGERGHYEIAAGNRDKAIDLLRAMEEFANNGLLPEQIWDTDDIPEKGLFFGKHTGSAMPLTWAHSEYIKLCTSIQDNRVFDMPQQTYDRYVKRNTRSNFVIWRFNDQVNKIPSSKKLRIEVFAEAIVHWTDDNWKTTRETQTTNLGIGIFVADIFSENGNQLVFTFFWKDSNHWENMNFSVEVLREAKQGKKPVKEYAEK